MNIKKSKFSLIAGIMILCAATVTVFAAGSKRNGKSASEDVGFKVSGFTPEGELSADIKYPQIQIHFTKPVVALAELGKQTAICDYASIEPKLNG